MSNEFAQGFIQNQFIFAARKRVEPYKRSNNRLPVFENNPKIL
jgi:hypothetical protein